MLFPSLKRAINPLLLITGLFLTCLAMKIFELCIIDLLTIKCNDMLKCNQHGFRHGKSCLTQLFPFVEKLAEALNNQSRIDVVYFDFAKAFDSVNHDLILKKLNINLVLMAFFYNFLRTTYRIGNNR